VSTVRTARSETGKNGSPTTRATNLGDDLPLDGPEREQRVREVVPEGKGDEAFHRTAPHGAGRVMSRREAHETGSLAEFEAAMEGVYSESVVESVIDEAPMAYKPAESIASAIEPTAEIDDWLDVVHNLKARE